MCGLHVRGWLVSTNHRALLHLSFLLRMRALSCLTLCGPMDCSPAGSSVRGILQARILEWVAIFHSRGSSQPRDWTQVSCIGRQVLYHLNHRGSPSYTFRFLETWEQHREAGEEQNSMGLSSSWDGLRPPAAELPVSLKPEHSCHSASPEES